MWEGVLWEIGPNILIRWLINRVLIKFRETRIRVDGMIYTSKKEAAWIAHVGSYPFKQIKC